MRNKPYSPSTAVSLYVQETIDCLKVCNDLMDHRVTREEQQSQRKENNPLEGVVYCMTLLVL
jgi:hypothetical protein